MTDAVLLEQLRNIRSERDKLRSALEQYATLVFDLKIERDGLLDLLTDAQLIKLAYAILPDELKGVSLTVHRGGRDRAVRVSGAFKREAEDAALAIINAMGGRFVSSGGFVAVWL